jgi:hypothetical protein
MDISKKNNNDDDINQEIDEVMEELSGDRTSPILTGCGKFFDSSKDREGLLFDTDDFELQQEVYRDHDLEEYLEDEEQRHINSFHQDPPELSEEEEEILKKQEEFYQIGKIIRPMLKTLELGKKFTLTSSDKGDRKVKIGLTKIGQDYWLLEKENMIWRADTDQLVAHLVNFNNRLF